MPEPLQVICLHDSELPSLITNVVPESDKILKKRGRKPKSKTPLRSARKTIDTDSALFESSTPSKPPKRSSKHRDSDDEDDSDNDLLLSTKRRKSDEGENQSDGGNGEVINDENDLRGEDIYGFAIAKKKVDIISFAKSQTTTPNEKATSQSTPLSSKKTPNSKFTQKAETRTRTPRNRIKSGAATPGSAAQQFRRNKNEQALSKVKELDVSDDDDSEDGEDEAEEEDEEESEQHIGDVENTDDIGTERYFEDQLSKSITSNNTLSQLPTLNHKQFLECLASQKPKHANENSQLEPFYERYLFIEWFTLLHQGFNLMFYGYGSKKHLLTKFTDTILPNVPVLEINGYFPTLTIKDILTQITSSILSISTTPGQLSDHLDLILNAFSSKTRPYRTLYILIHNIDGPSLRSEKAQTTLSHLAAHPNIRFIASIDSIHAVNLWDVPKSTRFNWTWHNVTTFRDYLIETSLENSIMVQQDKVTIQSAITTLGNLPDTSRNVFKLLLEHQLDSLKSGSSSGSSAGVDQSGSMSLQDHGIPYTALYSKCREEFLVTSEVNFKSILTEFWDHKIVVRKTMSDGSEVLFVPFGSKGLEAILERLEG